MRLLIATVVAFILTACAGLSVPGEQTLGISNDPEQRTKEALVAASIAVDTLAVYAALPSCGKGLCRDDRTYVNAKLVAQSGAAGLTQLAGQKSPSGILLTAGLVYMQWQIAKNIAKEPGPTNPSAAPGEVAAKQLQALGMADLLISTADERVREASGPNVTVAGLSADLQARVAALP